MCFVRGAAPGNDRERDKLKMRRNGDNREQHNRQLVDVWPQDLCVIFSSRFRLVLVLTVCVYPMSAATQHYFDEIFTQIVMVCVELCVSVVYRK